MAAPDFSQKTIEMLSTRAALRCSNPDCDILTVGPHSKEDKRLVIGEAAHIYGARPSERRYRREMSDQERAMIANGIWLCRNCHGEIDKDPSRFPVDLLISWKKAHEEKIVAELGSAGEKLRQATINITLDSFRHLPAFIQEVIRNKPDFWEFILTAELLDHYMSGALRRSLDLKRGLILKQRVLLPPEQFTRWLTKKPAELLAIPPAMLGLIDDLQRAWGEPGQPGNEHEIDHVCRLFSDVAEHLVQFAEDTKFTTVPDGFEGTCDILIEGALHALKRFPELSAFLRQLVADAPQAGSYTFDFILDLPDLWAERFEEELQKGWRAFQERDHQW